MYKIRKLEREREREWERQKPVVVRVELKVYLYADPGFLSIARPIRGHCRLNTGVP
jgi:hypothetical protein